MREAEDNFIRRAAAAIVIISSIVIISLMLTGGCDGSATSNQIPTPTPTFAPSTGFPPECNGTLDIGLGCPAADLKGSFCVAYRCSILDGSGEPGEEFIIGFDESCTDVDCFTLECQDVPVGGVSESPIFLIESVNDIPVADGSEVSFDLGAPGGTIILEDGEFPFSCGVNAIP